VVRLKGGDPFVFGRGGEEAEHLRAAGIEVEVVNGITAGLAATTALGVPLTHREHAHGVMFMTGHARPARTAPTGRPAGRGTRAARPHAGDLHGRERCTLACRTAAEALSAARRWPWSSTPACPAAPRGRHPRRPGRSGRATRPGQPAVIVVGDVLRGVHHAALEAATDETRTRRLSPGAARIIRRGYGEAHTDAGMLDKLNQLTESHGELRPGKGLISGVIALSLAILCFLGVLAFHFPEYLTTPQLRKSYDVDVIRKIMFAALVIAGGIAIWSTPCSTARAGWRSQPSRWWR
jgi:hypothetical protein